MGREGEEGRWKEGRMVDRSWIGKEGGCGGAGRGG